LTRCSLYEILLERSVAEILPEQFETSFFPAQGQLKRNANRVDVG